jgi:hypothetical protein
VPEAGAVALAPVGDLAALIAHVEGQDPNVEALQISTSSSHPQRSRLKNLEQDCILHDAWQSQKTACYVH